MKKIIKCFTTTRDIVEFIKESENINEGLQQWLNAAKEKLSGIAEKVMAYAKGLVAKLGSWFMVTNENGDILPCSTPLTTGYAWKNGLIKKASTFVAVGNGIAKLVGGGENASNAKKLPAYKQSTLQLWRNIYEGQELSNEHMINEVKMGNEDPEAAYNVIVDDDELRDEIEFHMDDTMARLMIWGAPGIGKTAILMNVLDVISKKQGKDYSLIVKTLSNETPDNFMLPKYTDDGRADDVPKTWLPVWRPTGDAKIDKELDAKCGRGLLFIDELSRATQQVQNVILPLINEGIINGWKLGSGWSIVCASNRDEDEMGGGQTQIGNALSNRFAQIYYEPTCKTWRKWADKQGFMSPLLTQWLEMPKGETLAGGKYFYWDPNEEGDGENTTHLMCTPRSWTNAMKDLARRHHTGTLEGFNIFDIDERWIKRVLNKYVPAKAVDSFWAFLQTIQRIGDFDAAVESVWHNNGKGLKIAPKDLVRVALPLAQLVICAHKDSLPTEKEFESLATWVVSTNNEQLATYVLDVFKNVYAANIPDSDTSLGLTDLKSYILVLKKLYDKDPKTWKHIPTFNAFLNAWGVTFETMPDYNTGRLLLAKKYGEIFKASVVDGKEGLG